MLKQQSQHSTSQMQQQHQLLPNLDLVSPVNTSPLAYFDDNDHSLSKLFSNVYYFGIQKSL